jgi:hypothetical protein
LRTDFIKIPDEIKGVKLNDEQKQTLMEGKPLYLEGMISKKERSFRQRYSLMRTNDMLSSCLTEAKQSASANTKQHKQSAKPTAGSSKTFRGKELDDEQYNKFKAGQTIYIELKDKKTNRIRVISLSTKIPEKPILSFPVSTKHG